MVAPLLHSRVRARAHLIAALFGLSAVVSATPAAAQENSRLVLQIHSVKCIDESNGKYFERIGGDEIVVSGVAIDAAGRAKRVATLKAGKFGRDGATKRYSPPHEFHTFDLTSGPAYPRTFRMMFVVVERDEGGGFQTVVNTLVNKANAVAQEASANGNSSELLSKALTAAATGNVTAALTQLVTEETARILTKKLKDDIFPPQLDDVSFKSATARFGGSKTTSSIRTVRTKAHGGKYEIRYSWRVE